MSEQRELPQFIGITHERFKTPYISILLTSIVVLIWTLASTFFSAVAIATITRLIVYATTCLALPVFRSRENSPKAEFIAPFGIIIAILSLILIVWLLTQVDFAKEGFTILFVAEIGLFIGLINEIFRKIWKQ